MLIHDCTQQQNNDKHSSVSCCINVLFYNKNILLKDSETFAAKLWIARRCLKVQVTESLKKTDVLDKNKLEHVLEE